MMNSKLRRFSLALSLVSGFGPRKYSKLLNHFDDSIESVYAAYKDGRLPDFLISGLGSINIDHYLKDLEDRDVLYVCSWESTYPRLLSTIPDAPSVLYYRGRIGLLNQGLNLGVVGTRNATANGRRWCRQFLEPTVQVGITLVSGMARGIDVCAHRCALEYGGDTVAVMPGPVDQPVPQNHSRLMDEILTAGGCLVSEVSPGSRLAKGMFPARNRIIAGLSNGVLVVEAGERSGASITARLGLEYNREVFAIPGSIDLPQSMGTNNLISAHIARLVTNSADMLECLGVSGHNMKDGNSIKNVSGRNDDEKRILVFLKNGPKSLESIAAGFDISTQYILSLLSLLQLDQLIVQNTEGNYELIVRINI